MSLYNINTKLGTDYSTACTDAATTIQSIEWTWEGVAGVVACILFCAGCCYCRNNKSTKVELNMTPSQAGTQPGFGSNNPQFGYAPPQPHGNGYVAFGGPGQKPPGFAV